MLGVEGTVGPRTHESSRAAQQRRSLALRRFRPRPGNDNLVTQLALLLALGSTSIVLSFVLARIEARRGLVVPTLKRIEAAVERAALVFLRAVGVHALLWLLLVGAALSAAALLLGRSSSPAISNGGRVAFMTIALFAGATGTLLHARLTLAVGARACSGAAAVRGSSRSLQPLLRASAALAGFGEGLGLLSVALAFAALYAVRGGFAQAGSAELASEVARLLPALPLGAAVAAFAVTRGGATLAAATLVGGAQTSEREARMDVLDPRNPATLAELLANQVGGLLPRSLSSYVAGVSANVAAALLAVAAASHPTAGESPLMCVLLLLVVRVFGFMASICGAFAARADGGESPQRALLRAQLTALAVSVFGLCAGLYWLRVEAFVALFVPGAAGLVVSALLTQMAWWPLRRDASATREAAEARALGDGAAAARATSAGLLCLLPTLLLPALALWFVELAPVSQATPPSQALRLAAFVAGLMATAPLSMAIASFGTLGEAAHTAAALARLDPDAQRPSLRFDEASALGAGAAASHATLTLAASLMLGLFALHAGSEDPAPGTRFAAVAGAVVLVAAFTAGSARRGLLGARGVAEEVKRQLQGLPRKQGTISVPTDYTPSYKACVESALDSARAKWFIDPIWPLLVPFALVSVLRGDGTLLSFAGAVVMCGLTFVLCSRATRGALREARRRSRHLEPSSTSSSGEPRQFGDLLGLGAAAGVEALMAAVALSTSALASLLA